MSFPNLPNRKSTHSYKWEKYKGQDILPMWVADTEFECAQPIIDSLKQRVDHGVLGYTLPSQYTPANEAVVSWCSRRYGWSINADWIVWMPGVVPAFNVASKAFGQTSENKGRILIQEPNYPPLLAAPALNGCDKVLINTIEQNGRWSIDFDQLEKEAAHPDTHLMILCNPMNPVGSVMSKNELDQIARICEDHNVLLCSDEIHCDLILDDTLQHIPASAHSKLEHNSITLMAASKTFNVAGLGTAFAIIPNARIRKQFTHASMGIVPWVNILGLVATEVAFTQCDNWYNDQLEFLRENRAIVVEAINNIPGLKLISPEATFLAWVDASGLDSNNVQAWCESKGVGPSPGADFGWDQFFRINFGCGRDMLLDALSRLSRKATQC